MLWKLLLPSQSGTAVCHLKHPKLTEHSKAMPKFAQQTPFPLLMDCCHCLERIFLLLCYFSSGLVVKSFFCLSQCSVFCNFFLWYALDILVYFSMFSTDTAFKLLLQAELIQLVFSHNADSALHLCGISESERQVPVFIFGPKQ